MRPRFAAHREMRDEEGQCLSSEERLEMQTSRRQFLQMSSALGAMLPMGTLTSELPRENCVDSPWSAGQENAKSSSVPSVKFSGTDLSGWKARGPGKWNVKDGEIVANGEGWLALNQGLQDFALKFLFRSSGAEVGIILRNAPVSWSRFSHIAEAGGKTAGIYVDLTGKNPGSIYLVEIDAERKESHRKQVPAPPLDLPGQEHKMAAGACAPIACAGINNPRGALTGYPPEPPIRISEAEGGWKSVEILLRGPAFGWDTTGVATIAEERSQFGELAFHVSGGAGAT